MYRILVVASNFEAPDAAKGLGIRVGSDKRLVHPRRDATSKPRVGLLLLVHAPLGREAHGRDVGFPVRPERRRAR